MDKLNIAIIWQGRSDRDIHGKNLKSEKKSSYDNTPSTFIKGNIFKGPFHLPRMLMILFALERDGNFDEYLK